MQSNYWSSTFLFSLWGWYPLRQGYRNTAEANLEVLSGLRIRHEVDVSLVVFAKTFKYCFC